MRKAWIWLVAFFLLTAILLGVGLSPLRLFRSGRYAPLARQTARLYGLDAALLLAVANVESGFDPNAVSPVGAVGLMQVMPSTARWICLKRSLPYDEQALVDPLVNMDLAGWYLQYLLQKFPLEYALCAYNAGEGVVTSWQQKGIEPKEVPYPETRHYVKRVLRLYRAYRRLGVAKDQ